MQVLATSYRLAGRAAGAVPAATRYRLAGAGGAAWFLASRGQHRNALRNYGVVLGRPPTDPLVRETARRAFENYGQMLVDFVLLGSLDRAAVLERITYQGTEHVDSALAMGRGSILVAPHMGSWDGAASLAGVLGYPVSAVADTFPGSLNDVVVGTRQALGLDVIPVGRSAVGEIRRALAANRLVALLCDLPQGPGGIDVTFFGQPARVPAGPAAFARRMGATIVPLYSYRVGPGRYHVEIGRAIEVRTGGQERAAQAEIMQGIVHVFEGFIRARPDQWYAFKPMFQ